MAEAPESQRSDSVRNVLFIMCDQLRADALSCHGGLIDTPNIDALAARGVRFDRSYVQGAVCGSSRMSFYTGRYVQSHGARFNTIPLAINQRTMGDHLRPLGVRTALVGKTHMAADRQSMEWLGLDPEAPETIYLAECGFEPAERDDGLHPETRRGRLTLPYNRFLQDHGYGGDNPWHTAANAVIDADGKHTSGWLLRASPFPSIVPDELSETAYMTDKAIDFIREAGDEQWCLHLSFIKPHWPYVVSEPYHQLVSPLDLPDPVRTEAELGSHPVLDAFQRSRTGRAFSRDEARAAVYPAYLGLVKQIDDHLGRLFAELDRLGRTDDTMIVLTSDHGDYLGDHWMGEKDWFHEPIVNVPMIVADPRPSADATRGTASSALVEAIDLAPTFVEAFGGDPVDPWLEGQSLVPLLCGDESQSREAAVSETEFGFLEMSGNLPPASSPIDWRATMLTTDRYKYILSGTGPSLLYDLEDDPNELVDRAGDPALATVEADLHDRMFRWYRERSNEVTRPVFTGHAPPDGIIAKAGFVIGYWDESDVEADGALASIHLDAAPPQG